MPGVKKRHSGSNVNALVAAAEAGDVDTLRQLLEAVDPNLQTAVRLQSGTAGANLTAFTHSDAHTVCCAVEWQHSSTGSNCTR